MTTDQTSRDDSQSEETVAGNFDAAVRRSNAQNTPYDTPPTMADHIAAVEADTRVPDETGHVDNGGY